MTLYRGLAEDLRLEPWLDKLWQAEAQFVRPETVDLGFRLAAAEMIRGGITCAVDMYWHPHVTARVAQRAGFRVVNGPVWVDFPGPDGLPVEHRAAYAREFLQEFRGDPLVTPCVMPHSTYTVSPDYLRQALNLADEYGARLSTHSSESDAEMATVTERFGRTPPQHLDQLGLLDERMILAHCVHLPDEDIDLLARRRSVVAHCPVSNMKLGCGLARVADLQRAGARVGLGTDGPVSSNDLHLWPVMRLTAILQKGTHKDPSLLPSREVVRMATRDGAEAAGLGERIGSLEAGKEADVILIDLGRPHLTPLYDVYAHLVYSVGPQDVSTVIIRGRPVMRARKLTTLDEAGTLAEMQALSGEVASALNVT
jgi:5-methylthioadenosine/S-adenosylhomocysteine deaminase